MVLSDVSIRKALAEGRIMIDPFDEADLQPSSVDLHIDRYFRVFRNDTTPFIDPKVPQEDLTELVEVPEDGRFILHPGEFVLGSTFERVRLADDLVARLEGKSSLGRLGLLIHSSLPGSETVMVADEKGQLAPRPIQDVVRKQLQGYVVAFDPETFRADYHAITGWYEGPPDRIYEVVLQSGRRVRVTAGHNLFTLDRDGSLAKVRTGALAPGTFVALPRSIPEPPVVIEGIDVLGLIPEAEFSRLVISGPAVDRAIEDRREEVRGLLKQAGIRHHDYWMGRRRLPLHVALQIGGFARSLTSFERLAVKGGNHSFPIRIEVDDLFAWFLGVYLAEGSLRSTQFTVSNTNQEILDDIESLLTQFGLPVYRSANAVTCCSKIMSSFLRWFGAAGYAREKRIPSSVFGWPEPRLQMFLDGYVDGDGSRDATRTSVWTCSNGMATDMLALATRLGLRASLSTRTRGRSVLHQVQIPHREHKTLTAVPLPDGLLRSMRAELGWSQREAARRLGYRGPTDLCNIENRSGRDAVRRTTTLQRFCDTYAGCSEEFTVRLERLVSGDLMWDRVVEVLDTGVVEPVFDLEVRPGKKIENFVAGGGGVFVSNTAGFVDSGWDGHLTLELSNVANLPIALYPGMKIGQISFLEMTTAAEHPYGSREKGSKYQGQTGPTPSRYYLNFRDD